MTPNCNYILSHDNIQGKYQNILKNQILLARYCMKLITSFIMLTYACLM